MLMMFVAPSSATWIQNTRLRSTAESVARGLQTARLEAMRRNTVVYFKMTDANSSAWQVCLYDAVNNVCFAAAGSVLAQRDSSEDNSVTKLGADLPCPIPRRPWPSAPTCPGEPHSTITAGSPLPRRTT
jgi:type IV fimbrial biogenesis protein FimT